LSALRLAVSALLRDWRSGELMTLLAALMIGVTALSAVSMFTSRITVAVQRQAGEVLAADLVWRSGRPASDELRASATDFDLKTANVSSFPSMAWAGDEGSLAEVRAVDEAYPLRGTILVAEKLFGDAAPTTGVPRSGEAWAEARLLARLGLEPGDSLRLGELDLVVGRVLERLPDQGFQFVDLAPTLLVNQADIARSGLLGPGSRVTYRLLFSGEPGDIAGFRSALEPLLEAGERLRGLEDVRPEIGIALKRAEQFLGLSALVSVMICAIAIAMAARRYAQRHLDTAALMKCLGASQRQILTLGLWQLGAIALIGGIGGTLLAYFAQALLARVLSDMVGGALPPPSAASLLLGPFTALAMILAFALPPLAQLRRVPPIRVLRKDVAPSPGVVLAYLSAAVGIVLMLLAVLRETSMVLLSAIALAGTLAALYVCGWVLVYALKSVRGSGGAAWRYGLANLARRRRESVVQLVAFGLGLMVLLLLSVVRGDLLAAWQATLPPDAPNNFLINIQPPERDALSAVFDRHDVERPQYWPLVRARLAEINGVAARDIGDVSERGRRFLEREANLSWSTQLQVGNRLADGTWWGDDGQPPGVSVEVEFAEALGLKLGDQLRFDVAGEPVTAPVTSFRIVEWDSFRPNFFMVLSPGLLPEEAGTFISAAHVPGDQRQLFVDIARELPGVTVFDMEALLGQVRGVMDKAALAVQIVFLFTLAAGVVVLLAAVQASLGERRYEAAMLRTLGARRSLVLRAIATEFVVVGMLAGLLGAIGAGVAGSALAKRVFELDYAGSGNLALVGLVAGALLVGVSGTLAARSAVQQPPVMVLRE